jgi:hypothetical protein
MNNPREIFEIGFSGGTIHRSWSLIGDHPYLPIEFHCNRFHLLVAEIY